MSAFNTNRFDIYLVIHKALRLFMADTLQRLGALDVDDDADLDAAQAQLSSLLGLLRSHMRHENDFVHTAIEARRPGGASTIAQQHVEHLDHIAGLEAEMAAIRRTPVAQRDVPAGRLYRHLALFIADNLEHMHIEETQHNAALWAHYSDAELHAVHGRLLASIPPEENALVLHWAAPALPVKTLAQMLKGAPPPAQAPMLELAQSRLDAPRRAKLAAALDALQEPA